MRLRSQSPAISLTVTRARAHSRFKARLWKMEIAISSSTDDTTCPYRRATILESLRWSNFDEILRSYAIFGLSPPIGVQGLATGLEQRTKSNFERPVYELNSSSDRPPRLPWTAFYQSRPDTSSTAADVEIVSRPISSTAF